jgi:hypothetical protein
MLAFAVRRRGEPLGGALPLPDEVRLEHGDEILARRARRLAVNEDDGDVRALRRRERLLEADRLARREEDGIDALRHEVFDVRGLLGRVALRHRHAQIILAGLLRRLALMLSVSAMRHGPSISICEKPITFLPPPCPPRAAAATAAPPPLPLSLRQPTSASASANNNIAKTANGFRPPTVDFIFHLECFVGAGAYPPPVLLFRA